MTTDDSTNPNACDACRERGKTWQGDSPKCAFMHGHHFSSDNWCCATMGELRHACEEKETWSNDDYAGVVAVQELVADTFSYRPTHIVIHWYKSRGRTDGAIVFDGHGGTHTLEADLASAVARSLAEERKRVEAAK
jgi:hypothetical protein